MPRSLFAAAVLLVALTAPVYADELADPHGDHPRQIQSVPIFLNGFASLAEQLGDDIVGEPVEFEHPVTDADAVQLTTRGLFVWRKGEPVGFTNGAQTFVLQPPAMTIATYVSPARSSLVDCIIARESHGYSGAVNPRSGASGLGQFLPSTWRTTPQGRAGLSVFDPVANRAAVAWMLDVGRGGEFSTIGFCR